MNVKILNRGLLIGLAVFGMASAGAAAGTEPEKSQESADKNQELPQAHTTPSGVTTAQPGGGNPQAVSPNAATPASPAARLAPVPTLAPSQPTAILLPTPAPTAPAPNQPTAVAPLAPARTTVARPPSGFHALQRGRGVPGRTPGLDRSKFRVAVTPSPAAPALPEVCLSLINTVLTDNGRWLLVPSTQEDALLVLNARTKELITRLQVGAAPVAIALSKRGGRAYVAGYHGASVTEISVDELRVTSTIPVGNNPAAVALSPDGKVLYVANAGDNTLTVIDTESHRQIAVVPVGVSPQDVKVAPDGKSVFVVNAGDATVSVVDPITWKVVATIQGR